jgi:flagellin-like protein
LKVSKRGRAGISEIMASVLAIAVTLIAGAAVFGYVNSSAAATEKQYGTSVGATVDYLSEQFSVVDMSFTSSTQVVVYIFNYGSVPLYPVQIIVYNSAQTVYLTYSASTVVATAPSSCSVTATTAYENPLLRNPSTNSGLSIGMQSITTVTLTLTSCSNASFGSAGSGVAYYVKVTGIFGNTVVYYQVR